MTTYISYEQTKKMYDDFKKSLPEDKFDRYYTELKILRSLISSAKNENKEVMVFLGTWNQDEAYFNDYVKILKALWKILIK